MPSLLLVLLVVSIAYITAKVVYNVNLHPLAAIPGPRSWCATRIPYISNLVKGRLVQRLAELHDEFGPCVRIAPNEVSFTSPQAWNDIYTLPSKGNQSAGRIAFPKSPVWHSRQPDQPDTIMTADPSNHARMRTVLATAFTRTAVMEQEKLVQKHVDHLISALEERTGTSAQMLDIGAWIDYTMFDITGDLCFGEPFGCLQDGRFHPWIANVFAFFKAASFAAALRFLGLESAVRSLIPKRVAAARAAHFAQVQRWTQKRRLAGMSSFQHQDFFDALSQTGRLGGLSDDEIEVNLGILIMAGSETTATTLRAILGYLTQEQNRECLLSLRKEVQQLSDTAGLNFTSLEGCEYLHAVIQEGLRLAAPVPCGIPRETPPGGGTVCGIKLPGKIHVSVHNFAINRSKLLWADPDKFAPSRWLGEKHQQGVQYLQDQRHALKPFSAGPRSCLGHRLARAEMSLIIARLLTSFDLSTTTTSSGGGIAWEKQANFSLWGKEPVRVKVERLQDTSRGT